MNDFFQTSMFAGVALSIISYLIGVALKKKFNLGIFNPLLISIVISIIVLFIGKIDYKKQEKIYKINSCIIICFILIGLCWWFMAKY